MHLLDLILVFVLHPYPNADTKSTAYNECGYLQVKTPNLLFYGSNSTITFTAYNLKQASPQLIDSYNHTLTYKHHHYVNETREFSFILLQNRTGGTYRSYFVNYGDVCDSDYISFELKEPPTLGPRKDIDGCKGCLIVQMGEKIDVKTNTEPEPVISCSISVNIQWSVIITINNKRLQGLYYSVGKYSVDYTVQDVDHMKMVVCSMTKDDLTLTDTAILYVQGTSSTSSQSTTPAVTSVVSSLTNTGGLTSSAQITQSSTDINACSPNPCQNGATCAQSINNYMCTCVEGYTGSDCQTDIDECSSSPCLNSGICSNEINQFTCTCTSGFTGFNCRPAVLGDDCSVQPAVCSHILKSQCTGGTCRCLTGYEKTGKATCSKIDCGTLSAPMNGEVNFSQGTKYRANASFMCKTGYMLVGLPSPTCTSAGTWSSAAPVCQINDKRFDTTSTTKSQPISNDANTDSIDTSVLTPSASNDGFQNVIIAVACAVSAVIIVIAIIIAVVCVKRKRRSVATVPVQDAPREDQVAQEEGYARIEGAECQYAMVNKPKKLSTLRTKQYPRVENIPMEIQSQLEKPRGAGELIYADLDKEALTAKPSNSQFAGTPERPRTPTEYVGIDFARTVALQDANKQDE